MILRTPDSVSTPDAHGYWWGSIFFAVAVAAAVACLPYAISCCSRFSKEQIAIRASFGEHGWAPGITPVAIALLDWPMGFRLLIMTIVAATLCLLCTVSLLFAARSRNVAGGPHSAAYAWLPVGEALLGSFMVGVLYILAAYAVGFKGYIGPGNLLWFFGVPAAIAFMIRPSLLQGLVWTLPLLIGGWVCMAIISVSVGIPLD